MERDAETGLDHNGDRSYDSRLGRSTSIDPFAMKSPGLSPYSYAGNNPVIAIDLNGDEVYMVADGDTVEYTGGDISTYRTTNKKILAFIRLLNQMYADPLGRNILSDLMKPNGGYFYREANKYELPDDYDGAFRPLLRLGQRGGEIILRSLWSGTIAHETAHGGMYANGLDSYEGSVWEEVTAFAFQYHMAGGPLGFDDWNTAGNYTIFMQRYVDKGYDDTALFDAIGAFKGGSLANNKPGVLPSDEKFHPYEGLKPYTDLQSHSNFLKMKMGR